MSKRKFKIWRGDSRGGEFNQYDTDVDEGMRSTAARGSHA